MARFYIYKPNIGFFNDEYNEIPKEALPLSEDKFNELFSGQARGEKIVADISGNLYLEPMPVYVPPKIRQYSSNEFMAFFTEDEQDRMAQAARTNNKAFLWLTKVSGAQYIDLDDPLTEQGLNFLLSLGIIDNDRLTEILKTGE